MRCTTGKCSRTTGSSIDLPKSLSHSKSILFADDTTIYSASQNPITAQQNIENMSTLSDWFCANKLSLNAQKNNFIIFSPKNTRTNISSLNLAIIQKVSCINLGICQWGEHINMF